MNDSFDSLLPSRFIKQDDVETPMKVTIAGYEKGTLKNSDTGAEDPATFLKFEETDKMVVFKTWTAEALKELFPDGKSSSIGQQVELYKDGNVKFGAKKVGGVRIRAVSGGKSPF